MCSSDLCQAAGVACANTQTPCSVPCPYMDYGPYGQCSLTCSCNNQTGLMTRQPQCKTKQCGTGVPGFGQNVAMSVCTNAGIQATETLTQACVVPPCISTTTYRCNLNTGPCSAKCGGGQSTQGLRVSSPVPDCSTLGFVQRTATCTKCTQSSCGGAPTCTTTTSQECQANGQTCQNTQTP